MARRSTKSKSITAVARVAGVSIATVSRVMNGHPHVAQATVEAVNTAMKQIGYLPRHSLLQTGAAGRTGNIAVLFPDVNQDALRTTLSGRLLHGIGEVLRQRELTMVVTGLPANHSTPACIDQKKVDGVIIRGSRMAVEVAGLTQSIPCVWVFEAGYQSDFDVDMILEDNAAIGRLAATWLARRGHKSFAVLDPSPDHPSFHVRRIFFVDAASQLGISVAQYAPEKGTFAIQVARMLESTRRPTGIFIPGGDEQIVGAYRQMQAHGLRLGKDFELISCNNDQSRLAALDPMLPNIDIQPEIIGRAAVDSILWRIQHPQEERRKILVSPKLVEGESPAASHA